LPKEKQSGTPRRLRSRKLAVRNKTLLAALNISSDACSSAFSSAFKGNSNVAWQMQRTREFRNVEVLTLLDRHLPRKLNAVLSAAILEKEPPRILRLKSLTSPTLGSLDPPNCRILCSSPTAIRSATRNCLSELGEALCDSRSGSCLS